MSQMRLRRPKHPKGLGPAQRTASFPTRPGALPGVNCLSVKQMNHATGVLAMAVDKVLVPATGGVPATDVGKLGDKVSAACPGLNLMRKTRRTSQGAVPATAVGKTLGPVMVGVPATDEVPATVTAEAPAMDADPATAMAEAPAMDAGPATVMAEVPDMVTAEGGPVADAAKALGQAMDMVPVTDEARAMGGVLRMSVVPATVGDLTADGAPGMAAVRAMVRARATAWDADVPICAGGNLKGYEANG